MFETDISNGLLVLIIAFLITQCVGCPPDRCHDPVHGSWGEWSPAMTNCHCAGRARQDRHCDNPSPAHGGRSCDGDSSRMKDCNECNCNNGQCDHQCNNYDGGYYCTCNSGYIPEGEHKCRRPRCKTDNWPAPTNGKKTDCHNGQEVPLDTTCHATCNDGYEMIGSSSSKCGDYGVWTRSPPSCKAITCSSITVQDNMEIRPATCTSNPRSGTTCTISCKNNFSLMRYSTSTHTTFCNKHGSWTGGSSFYCRDLAKPVFTSCQTENIKEFADKMQTKKTVTWKAIKAIDNDGHVPQISVYPSYLRADATSFEFAEGSHDIVFTAKDTNGNIKLCRFKITIKVIRCPWISSPQYGKTIPSRCTNLLGSRCTTECNDGYNMTGFVAARECIRDRETGKWTGDQSTCERIKCPYLHEPKHTKRTGYGCSVSNPVYQTSCNFECLPGYKTISGSKTRVCKADGQWSGDDFQCEIVMCPALPQLTEGLRILNTSCIQNSSTYQVECRYACAPGYMLLGPGKKSCSGTGQWSPAGNAYCRDISKPSFGSSCPSSIKTFADRHSWTAVVNWTNPIVTDNAQDKPIITQQGKKPGDMFTAGHHLIKYTATDKAGNQAQCLFYVTVEVIKCPGLTAPLRGSVKCSLGNVYGSRCSFGCNKGYSIKGSALRTCEKNGNHVQGKWTGITTVCEAITCPNLDPPKHGFKQGCLTNSFGERCAFHCITGYKHVGGSLRRTCSENGTWSGSPIACQAVTCPALSALPQVTIHPSSCTSNPTYLTTCQYKCATSGYKLAGWSIRTCLTSGQWNNNKNVSCHDIEKPRFTQQCPHSIDVFAKENMDYAEVGIPIVNATDNSGEVPTIIITGQKQNYSEGKHEITITATDSSGNKESCRFFIYVKILRCMVHPSLINNGKAVGKCANTWGSTCHFQCNNGFNMTGSSSRTCKAVPGHIQGYWSGTMPFCTINRCPPLSFLKNGYVYPPACTAKQGPESGTTCFLGCHGGFMQSPGTSTITCGKNSAWDRNVSTIISCKDVTPPQFKDSCPSDIRIPLQHDGFARANWTIPVAEDNTYIPPTVTVQPSNAVPPFSVNSSTTVTYIARDGAGNVGKCSFKIFIEDNIGPRVVYCPPNINKIATKLTGTVTWKTPEFADNSNVKVIAKCNRYSGETFYWGVWNIHCRGYDNNPNNVPAECSFTVTFKPKSCPPLNTPKNGAKVCDTWMMGRYCVPMCNDQYDFPYVLPFGAMWVCGAARGTWMPTSPLPDCAKINSPATGTRNASLLYYFKGNCNDPAVQEQIKSQFLQIVNSSSFDAICKDPHLKDKCNISNVDVDCGMQPAPGFSITGKRKRRSNDPMVLKITLEISVFLHHGTNQTKQEIKSEVANATEILNKLTSEIKTMAENGSLVLNTTGQIMAPVNGSFSTSTTSFACSPGQVFEKSQCISCPVGMYHNVTLEKCVDCRKGWYQSSEGQVSCKRCPSGMSTLNDNSKNASDCLAFCRPGHYSPTGLQPCFPCPKGSFQPFPSQFNCTQCSNSTTTEKTGAASPGKCIVPCQPGSYSSSGFEPNCTKCNKRHYQPAGESTSCYQCPGTTVTLSEGSTSRSNCIEINECLSNPCRAGSTCHDLVGDFSCSCPKGYTGKQCENDIDDCTSNPCQNNATCHDGLNSFSCTCLSGFTGGECEINIDECKQFPCLNNATCNDLIGRYECFCQPGYEGRRCEREKNECLPNPCMHGGTCQDQLNAFSCQCLQGFRGETCEENIDDCVPNPCNNSGQCLDEVNGYSCKCSLGYNGKNCRTDINECLSNPCQNNGTCYNEVGDFSCACVPGYNGSTCEQEIDECSSDPCLNGATCIDRVGSFECVCPPGYQGDRCDIDIDECVAHPCANNASCTNAIGSYTCNCESGFTGQTCIIDIDECLSSPCANNGSCEDGVDSFVCNCLDGFSGLRCQTNIDDCAEKPCQNNATCKDGTNEYLCQCTIGFTGQRCEAKIDHCTSNPCANNGKCLSLPTDFKCVCPKGYTGKNCSINIDDCINSPCLNNGKCQDLVGGYRCSCLPGFTGSNCSHNIDDCKYHGCLSNGTCVDGINSYSCLCHNGTTGKFCEVSFRPCDFFPCHNGATCDDKDDEYTCSCPEGFEGKNCEINIDDCKPVNPCKHNGMCTDLVSNYTCSCPLGVFGRNCENVSNYCLSANCSEHGNCINSPFGFKCNCSDGFYGPLCDHPVQKCISSPCQNGGRCHETKDGYNCSCLVGFNGTRCEINIDDCQHDKCLNNATCVDKVNDYLCLCHEGFNGTHCEDQLHSCKENPCQNNGTCKDIFGGYKCKCPERYGGQKCEEDKSPCLISPCIHGGNCTELNITSFMCSCKPGFTGLTCETNIDECVSSPCPLHANCIDQINGYTCQCHQSHTGKNCEIPLGDNFDLIFKTKSSDNKVELQKGPTIVPDMLNFAIALWVQPDTRFKEGTILTYMVPGNKNETLEISFTEKGIRTMVRNDELKTNGNVNITDGKWHFIGLIWNRYIKKYSIYFDGKNVASRRLESSGPPLKGNGKIVLGQRYSWNEMQYDVKASLVGVLRQVNFWRNVRVDQEYMWNAAHSCSWPVDGNVYSWIAFLSGVKGGVLKRFPSTCKALDLCKENCSHYVACHKVGRTMVCTCKEGFTGKLCEVNINDCLSNPCKHGRCVDDIASYKCNCDKGYYGSQCEQEIQDQKKECPPLAAKLPNGKVQNQSYAGQHIADLKCNDGFSFRQHDVTRYACGPQTDWRWNRKDKIKFPRCLSIAEPISIIHKYQMSLPLHPNNCQTNQAFQQLKESFHNAFLKSIKSMSQHGCFAYGPCKVKEFSAPKCSGSRTSRSVKIEFPIDFKLLFKEWGNSSSFDSTVTENSAAVAFQMKYAVTVGTFVMLLDGQAVKPRGNSLMLISKSHQCKDGYVTNNDNTSCVACPTGTYQSSGDCLPCPQGNYQDREGQTICKQCPGSDATSTKGATSKDQCSKKHPRKIDISTAELVLAIIVPTIVVILAVVILFIWKKKCRKDKVIRTDNTNTFVLPNNRATDNMLYMPLQEPVYAEIKEVKPQSKIEKENEYENSDTKRRNKNTNIEKTYENEGFQLESKDNNQLQKKSGKSDDDHRNTTTNVLNIDPTYVNNGFQAEEEQSSRV